MAFSKYGLISGRVLYVDGSSVWLAQGRQLLHSSDSGGNWRRRAVLPVNGKREYLTVHRLGRRLGRVGMHHFALTGPDSAVIVAHRHIFRFAEGATRLERVCALEASRPMGICVAQGSMYYGEYRGNSERSPVHVWAAETGNLREWKAVWRFENVRHVHGVYFDPYTSAIWVTTGDKDGESAIWMTEDRFQTLTCMAGGSQQTRTVQLLFAKGHVYFASDAPHDINHIYRLERTTGRIEVLATVAEPVFYGCKIGERLFFSTIVEPSTVNTGRHAVIWGSPDGSAWHVIARFKKDFLPKKLFQYGQVMFPAGPGDGEHLWFTPFSTACDQITFKMPCEAMFKES